MGNGTVVSLGRCITSGVTAGAAEIRTGNREQIYAHSSCINLSLFLLVTSASEQAGSEIRLHSNPSTAHFINYRSLESYKNKVLQNYIMAMLQASADTFSR